MAKCKNCNKKFEPKYFLQKNCEEEECRNMGFQIQLKKKSESVKPKKNIPKVSKKRIIENAKYSVLRIEFLGKKENKICPITKKPTTDIHHKKGRVGSLFLDTKFWVALSREGHKYVEENPEWAKENGYSLNRL